jgi:hypothetical protein
MDHNPSPAVGVGQGGELVAYKSTAQRAAALDDQDAAVAGLLQRGPNEYIILVDAHGSDRPRERARAAIVGEDRLCDKHGDAVLVAEIGG